MSYTIPIVNLNVNQGDKIGGENEKELRRIGDEVCRAFRDIGFVYLENHGVPLETIDEVTTAMKKFFTLPEEVKLNYARSAVVLEGYSPVNREKLTAKDGIQEIRESYDFMSFKDEVFPVEIENLKKLIEVLVSHFKSLTIMLLNALEYGLGIEEGFFERKHKRIFLGQNRTVLRILHYPPVAEGVEAIRCGEHSDYGTFTLLSQDLTGGLEVRDRKGKWIQAHPIPGTLLVNVGDMLQEWTAGDFPATKHRVLLPQSGENRSSSRSSMTFFVNPDGDTLIQEINGEGRKWTPLTAEEYLHRKMLNTYGY